MHTQQMWIKGILQDTVNQAHLGILHLIHEMEFYLRYIAQHTGSGDTTWRNLEMKNNKHGREDAEEMRVSGVSEESLVTYEPLLQVSHRVSTHEVQNTSWPLNITLIWQHLKSCSVNFNPFYGSS